MGPHGNGIGRQRVYREHVDYLARVVREQTAAGHLIEAHASIRPRPSRPFPTLPAEGLGQGQAGHAQAARGEGQQTIFEPMRAAGAQEEAGAGLACV